jgi:hypothetical protein
MIYTVPHHRRKGIQNRILNDLKDVSDSCGHSFCICADPFQLKGFGRETNAKESLLKMVNNDTEPVDNWLVECQRQRERFLSEGFINVPFDNARYTERFQQFVYVSRGANPDEWALLLNNQVSFEVDYKKLEELSE